MKILFLIRDLGYGGAQRQLVLLANRLARQGHRVTVAAFYAGGALAEDLDSPGVSCVSMNKRHRWNLFAFFWRASRIARSEKPEVIHGYLPTGNLLALLLRFACPRARIVWGIRASDMKLNEYPPLERLLYRLERRAAPFAAQMVVNSHAGYRHAALAGFPIDKMTVIPNGIDTDSFYCDPVEGVQLRREWGLAPEEICIGMVGRLDPMKGHRDFLEAAAIFIRQRKDCRFLCVGGGSQDYLLQMQELARALGISQH
ncbi:MAG: glycosyltransferase, partial [Bryobacteraceae bacterium]